MLVYKNRVFNKNGEKLGDYIFNRKHATNIEDIAECAALSMHKAIIGICGLDDAEMASQKMNISLRQYKAVQTYYVIYHLFTCCMLMDVEYEIHFSNVWNNQLRYGTSLENLRKLPKSGDEWNRRKFFEEDLAAKITHGAIKSYCGRGRTPAEYTLRERAKNNKLPHFLKTLYNSFVNEQTAVILYEKAAYIRDRTIYRPSHVVSETDTPIQTSLNCRAQIDSLPKAQELYHILNEIHRSICAEYRTNIETAEFFYKYMFKFTCSLVDCKNDYAAKLGYSLSTLNVIGGDEQNEFVPSYFAQLMELYSQEESILFYNKYWKNLRGDTTKHIREYYSMISGTKA